MKRIGFLVNPIAGMGGRVGLKGTDGVLDRAISLGAEPVAPLKAAEMLSAFTKMQENAPVEITWMTCSGSMGADVLGEAGFEDVEVILEVGKDTSGENTKVAVERFKEHGVDLVIFCGGDGTARDICQVTRDKVAILGIPSGVKMYSGVFGISPAGTAEILMDFLEDQLTMTNVEILDLDEDRYREGEWVVRLYDTALTPFESTLVQASKMMMDQVSEDGIKEEIAEYITEDIKDKPDTLFLLGPGSTVEFVARELNVGNTLLGIDAVVGGEVMGSDLNEEGILGLLKEYNEYRLILSPIGAQGFVLGRGNLQLSPEVIRRIGRKNIMVLSTPAKLQRTPVLRFDTGDAELDSELAGKGYFSVVMGYRLSRLVKVEI